MNSLLLMYYYPLFPILVHVSCFLFSINNDSDSKMMGLKEDVSEDM
jgi:hypothetical protein